MSRVNKNDKRHLLEAEFSRFAVDSVLNRDDLFELKQFPGDLWQKMGDQNLLGLGIEKPFGGLEENLSTISLMGKILAEKGKCMGVTLSWLIHTLVSRIISLHGTEKQKKTLLPELSKGQKKICLAVSEPETGPHPKYLRTEAIKKNDSYKLNGEKIWVTNAPVADIFIVISITKKTSHKNYFSAFIVPKDLPGISVSKPFDLPFFRPAPHGGIKFYNCPVTDDMILGEPDTAYEKIVIPFSETENIMMMGAVTGGMEAMVKILSGLVNHQNICVTNKALLELGDLKSKLQVLNLISIEASNRIQLSPKSPDIDALWTFFRKSGADAQNQIQKIIKQTGVKPDNLFELILNDLLSASSLSQKTVKNKLIKLGKGVLSGNNHV